MRGVGTGRRIAGRYALNERRAHLGSIEVWSALDATLAREVSITLFPSSFERADAILDAARQSAAINDHRLVRVLDVGSDDELSWLVEESLSESATIAELLARGPLPPEEARRIAGEIASGLDVAAARGLHHLHITPHSVRRTDGGLIKIAGLATAAALEGTPATSAKVADRIDTTAVVAVMYAAMTTRWPLKPSVRGLEDAPRIVGGVAAPSEIALAVPPDLDAVCRATLNHDTGPQSPGALVKRIAPWSATTVSHVVPKPASMRGTSAGDDATQVIPAAGIAGSDAQGTFARAAAHHRQQREHERAERAAKTRRRLEERRADPAFLDLPEALEDHRGPIEAPVPLMSSTTESEGKHAKLILALVAVLIVVALAFAVPTLQSMFASSPTPRAAPSGRATATASPSPSTAAPTRAPTSTSSTVKLEGVTAFDPQGDGRENDSAVSRAIDGDPSSKWTSEGYRNSAKMGGQKEGVGLAVEVPQGSTVGQVTLTMGAPGQDVTVYAASDRSLNGATKIGGITDSTTSATVLKAAQPVPDTRYVIVWVTKAAQESTNRYRASIAEVAVS